MKCSRNGRKINVLMTVMFLGVTYCLVRGFILFGTTCRGHRLSKRRYSRNVLESWKKIKGYSVLIVSYKGYSSWLAVSYSHSGLKML